jgi:hypothetical protein
MLYDAHYEGENTSLHDPISCPMCRVERGEISEIEYLRLTEEN